MGDHNTNYAPCDHIKRGVIDWTVDQDLINSIATEFRTLPSFENTTYEQKLTKFYSLQTNKLLKCRWDQYKSTIETKVFTPFEFPAAKDLHFYNGSIRFLPNLTLSRQKCFKMQMKSGPGIDFKGQKYIPYEMFMKRGISQKETISKRMKAKSEEKGENEDKSKDEKEIKKDKKVATKNLKTNINIKGTKKGVKTDLKLTKKDAKTDLKKDVKGTGKDGKDVTINAKKEDKNKKL